VRQYVIMKNYDRLNFVPAKLMNRLKWHGILYRIVMSADMKREFVRQADGDWDVDHAGVIICPCGHRIEDDGECPNGHVSPMRSAGLI